MIDYFSLGHPLSRVRSRYALKARERMFTLFMSEIRPSAEDKILDLGVTPDESLPESNFFEQLYPYRQNVTATSIEDARGIERAFPGVSFIKIPKGPLPFADNEFDVLFSSAVVEHVGDSVSQRSFVREAVRVSRRFFFTTPSRAFPIELHTFLPFLHWLPRAAHQASLRALGKNFWAQTENLNLLSTRSFVRLFPQCAELYVRSIRLFGFPSNILIYGRK